ncbi:MAG TPA: hypothetical protein VM324_06540 [Egibacteraceae bacterium]|nr:hypothetical protein [Egibacteraceae bacterium]
MSAPAGPVTGLLSRPGAVVWALLACLGLIMAGMSVVADRTVAGFAAPTTLPADEAAAAVAVEPVAAEPLPAPVPAAAEVAPVEVVPPAC